jgi:hypothetical protein
LKRYTEGDVKSEIVLKKEDGEERVTPLILYTIMKRVHNFIFLRFL